VSVFLLKRRRCTGTNFFGNFAIYLLKDRSAKDRFYADSIATAWDFIVFESPRTAKKKWCILGNGFIGRKTNGEFVPKSSNIYIAKIILISRQMIYYFFRRSLVVRLLDDRITPVDSLPNTSENVSNPRKRRKID